jgi:glycosyltransferase involved in cell wall biosynthesis
MVGHPMTGTEHTAEPPATGSHPSILMVSTISATLGFVFPFARHLRTLGWRVDAAANGATTDAGVLAAFDHGFEVPLSRSILDVVGIARSTAALRPVITAGDYDIVHVHTPIAAFLTRLVIRGMPRQRRPRVAYTAHGFHFHTGGHPVTNRLFLTMEQVGGRWTDRLVVINEEDRDAALRHHVVPARKLLFMPGIGVDTAHYDPAAVPAEQVTAVRADLGIPADAPVFVVVGELSIRKRPFDVVAALGEMRHQDAHVVLLGEGAERPRVDAAAEAADAVARVHYLGKVSDVRPAVLAADALVLASSREGLSRAILESLALGVPVVTTDGRGNPDLVVPDAGFVVHVGDVTALAGAMDRIIDDPAAATAMGAIGRRRIVEGYDQDRLIELHDRMYAELLAEGEAARS